MYCYCCLFSHKDPQALGPISPSFTAPAAVAETYPDCDANTQQSHSQSRETRWLRGSANMRTPFLNLSRCHPWERLCRASRSVSSAVRPFTAASLFLTLPSVKLSPGCSAFHSPILYFVPRSQFRPSPLIPTSPFATDIDECLSGCARPCPRIVSGEARISAQGLVLKSIGAKALSGAHVSLARRAKHGNDIKTPKADTEKDFHMAKKIFIA